MASVLLVDDDVMSVEFMKIFLEGEGHTVFDAICEEDALSLFIKNTPGVVITDISLGTGSGITLAKQIKVQRKEVKVIGVTGYSMEHLQETDVAGCFDNILVKPIDLSELLKVLSED